MGTDPIWHPKHGDGEGRIIAPLAQIPGGEAVLEPQTCTRDVGVEVAQGVAAIEAETHDEERILAQVRSQSGEHRLLGAWRQIRHHVAGDDCGVEPWYSGVVKLRAVDCLRFLVRGQRGG